MSLGTQDRRVQDGDFLRQVRQAAVVAALAVASEDPGTVNHAKRATLAGRILADPVGMGSRFAFAVATNGAIDAVSIGTPVADNDIQFMVNSIMDAESLGV